MHRVSTVSENASTDSFCLIEQTPAPIVFLTAADTDIQTLAIARRNFPPDFPAIRALNLLRLHPEIVIDDYSDRVLSQAQVVVLRLLGGRSYWSYGLEVCKGIAKHLIVLPGESEFDATLASHSSLSVEIIERLWRYFDYGGVENFTAAWQAIGNLCLGTSYMPPAPRQIPSIGAYQWQSETHPHLQALPRQEAGILFYRAHYLAGNLTPIDALCQALSDRGITPVPIYLASLQEPDLEEKLQAYFGSIAVLLNTTSFSLSKLHGQDRGNLWRSLNVPILQVILSSSTATQWQESSLGLLPRDVAMNVALPEVDGKIITRAISFKAVTQRDQNLETEILVYAPIRDRVAFVADLAQNWVRLRSQPIPERKIALILANYPTRNGRLANGVGLDTPASCIEILQAMQHAGYGVENLPQDGDALIYQLTQGTTNEDWEWQKPSTALLPLQTYQAWFATLPPEAQAKINQRWGEATSDFAIAGVQFGNVFVGIQPSRGYERDPSLNYHAPDLEPTHAYLAFYLWLRHTFQAQAIAHVGKHGNLEWLPGKGLALSASCFPEIALGSLPHLYPFIVNDPGEGTQAKRRAQAVILDHLTPPMTRAETYGNLQQLEHLIDEYYEAQILDPQRADILQAKIFGLIQTEHLQHELQIQQDNFPEFLNRADTYLCELKECQIRDGLHIFGKCPEGRQLRDLILAIARHPRPSHQGLTQALAAAFQLDFDPLTGDPAQPFSKLPLALAPYLEGTCRIVGDAIAALEGYAAQGIEEAIAGMIAGSKLGQPERDLVLSIYHDLRQTEDEITNFLKGLNGEYVPSGASGAPTRGRMDVLPTGKNFYSVDIRAIPTETAWDIGRRSAEVLIETYTQEHGDYPRCLGLSVWGTSTMRTGGDDLAQALALMGVRPVWDGGSRRVIDLEILPLAVLNRPRVDVTLRISGFFRDGFSNLIDLFHQAVVRVSQLDEPDALNPLKAKVSAESEALVEEGWEPREAIAASQYRIFGSKPGAYGAGLQGLIESQSWESDADLARAYLNWSSYAYTSQDEGIAAFSSLEKRLREVQVVLHNQDNREHDLLDSDDYYQFQGGMIAAVRSLTGRNPSAYFGDNALPQQPKVRSLAAEIARVYRSRVVNPKWIAGVMRHGYKGAFEIAATVDYLFAYDATAHCVADFMYEGVANAYLFNPEVRNFLEAKNPWALRDTAERLLEAHQRGLWASPSEEMREQLRSLMLEAEGTIEGL